MPALPTPGSTGLRKLLENSSQGEKRGTTFSLPETKRPLQNSLNDQDRSTNTLTLGTSPRGRGKCKTDLDLLPLHLGEGWGEGNRIQPGFNRGTISWLPGVLHHSLPPGRTMLGERIRYSICLHLAKCREKILCDLSGEALQKRLAAVPPLTTMVCNNCRSE